MQSQRKRTCSHCGRTLSMPCEYVDRSVKCPSCGQTVDAASRELETHKDFHDSGITMDTSAKHHGMPPCPFCGEKILPSAKKCRYCGEFLAGIHVVQTNVKQSALLGSGVCLVLAIALMWWSFLSFLLYTPLLVAAFILSIVAMAQGRVVPGLLILLLTIIAVPLAFWARVAIPRPSRSPELDVHTAGNSALSSPEALQVSSHPNGESDPSRQSHRLEDVQDKRMAAQAEEEKRDYLNLVQLYGLEAKYFKSAFDGPVPGVRFKLNNQGNRSLAKVKITVYFRDRYNTVIAERDYWPVNTDSWSEDSVRPLKPNYIWQLGPDKFYRAEGIPSEWQEGNATAAVTEIEFEQ